MKFKYLMASALLLLTLSACSDEKNIDDEKEEILTLDSIDKSEYAEIKFNTVENAKKTPEYIKIGEKYIYLDEIKNNMSDNELVYASNTFYNYLYENKLKKVLEKDFEIYFEQMVNNLNQEQQKEILTHKDLLNITYYNNLVEYLEKYLRLETFDDSERQEIVEQLKDDNSYVTNFYYVLLLENTEENKKIAETVIEGITDEASFEKAFNKYKESIDIQVGSKFLTPYTAQNALKDVSTQELNTVKFYTDSETLSTKEEVQMYIKVYDRQELTEEQFSLLVDDYILENYKLTTKELFKLVDEYYDDVEISEELLNFYDNSYLESFEQLEETEGVTNE